MLEKVWKSPGDDSDDDIEIRMRVERVCKNYRNKLLALYIRSMDQVLLNQSFIESCAKPWNIVVALRDREVFLKKAYNLVGEIRLIHRTTVASLQDCVNVSVPCSS